MATYTAKFISKVGEPPVQITFDLYKDDVFLNRYENTSAFNKDNDNGVLYIVAGDYFYNLSGKWILSGTADIGKTEKIIIQGYTFPTPTPASSSQIAASASNAASAPVPADPVKKIFTGKIIIKKKSGPGEITGITEIDLSDPNNLGTTSATFKELQFTEGGDYVLTISSTSDEIKPMDLSIKVIKEDEIVAQPESKGNQAEQKPVDGTRPIIAQIDKPSIKVPPIKMKQDGTGNSGQGAYTQGLGFTPLIWYKSIAIEERYIQSLRLYHQGIVPKIEFTFQDTKDIMKGEATPQDDTTIDLFLNSTSDNLKSLHMIFKMESFKQGPNVADQKFTIIGTIDVPNLYVVNNNTYKGTSFTAIRNICKELGLGFNSNIIDTKDEMPWRNNLLKPFNFIEDIISRSYISDDSFMAGYIDYYYCFNYVDVEKEMNRDASKDVGIDTSATISQGSSQDSDRILPLRLTTDPARGTSCNFVLKYTKNNDSTKKSLKEGYATVTKAYDRLKKQFLVFTVDSTTSDGSENIILKASQGDSKYQKENVKHAFLGKIDTDNVHTNFNYAATQNRINLNNLTKISIEATLPNANWNLYKFQKVYIEMINQTPTVSNPGIDWRYSGYYIIADIEYLWQSGKMSQKVRLVRKELGKTPEEIKNSPPVQQNPEVKENNPNPIPGATSSIVPAPNSVYVVGQTYLVQDKQGNKYELTVTSLSDNGIEVKGTLKSKQ